MTRNVVLVCLDTVRKDYFEEFAPRLAELADVSFEQCRAASAWSTPSHASMLTGKLAHQHGIHTHNRDFSGLKRADTFLADLPDHRTIGASANVYASSTFGFDGVFDDYSDIAPHRRFPDGMDMEKFIQEREGDGVARFAEFFRAAVTHDHPLQSVANGALFKLNDLSRRAPLPKVLDDGANIVAREALSKARAGSEPFFLFTNFMDAHGPVHHVLGYDRSFHDAPNTWTSFEFDDWAINVDGAIEENRQHIEYHRDLYGAAIDYLDRKVSEFVRSVREQTDRETTFVITADHGENMAYDADDGLWGHTSSLTESLLHVPCYIVNPPDGYAAEEHDYFSHLQLGDLLSGLACEETPDVFTDRPVAELVGIGVGGAPRDEDEHRYWDRMLRCAYDGETKFVWDSLGGRVEYRIDHDRPCWQEPVASGDAVEIPDWATARFDEDISAYKQRAADGETDSIAVDDATRQRLSELGYL